MPVATPELARFLAVVAKLRDPDGGCPWDLKQTHTSLKPHMLEEAYEAVEAIETGRPDLLREELGDVLLQVALHAQLAKDTGDFDFEAVCRGIADKLIRRHPHVFGDAEGNRNEIQDPTAVTQQWERIKAAEKAGQEKSNSILDGISKAQPALSRALETSKRAVNVGFEWPSFDSLWACVMSEYDELRQEIEAKGSQERLEEELGDILFATVNLARQLKIDPETALTGATAKFTKRFQRMEETAEKPLTELDFETWDALWEQAKQETHRTDSSKTPPSAQKG